MWQQLTKNLTRNNILQKCLAKNLSSTTESGLQYTENKVNVDGHDINYVETGEKEPPVLLLPGALGTAWTDFKPQIEYFGKQNTKVVAWDPPGYGKSRPPDRDFSVDFLHKDATMACNLMKKLGHEKFSVIGWSDGGITGLLMGAKCQQNIDKLIVIAANSKIFPEELEIYEKIRNIDSWSDRMKKPMIEIYGEELFRKLWSDWVDAMKRLYEKDDGDICSADLSKIKCRTLIVHGKQDKLVMSKHPFFLRGSIPNSKMMYSEHGGHNLHLKYPDEFNDYFSKFLDDKLFEFRTMRSKYDERQNSVGQS